MGLSTQDKRILDTIFGQRAHSAVHEVDITLRPDQHIPTEVVQQLMGREKEAIVMEKAGCSSDALAVFSQLIEMEPQYASAYNNRAQMRRILGESTDDIVSDLTVAIELAMPVNATDPVSEMQATILRNAHSQLAAVYLELSNDPKYIDRAWDLQLQASNMLVQSSYYGEKIAATLAATVNPFSKLCGSIVETAMAHGY